jgi:hypothetical protein
MERQGEYMDGKELEDFVSSIDKEPTETILPDETPTDQPTPEDESATPKEAEPQDKEVVKDSVAPVGEGKKTYSPEELEDLLNTDKTVDTSRLSPEGRLLMKSFQRGYDKKFQTLAEKNKEVSSQLEQIRDPQMRAKAELFYEYLQNPRSALGKINQELERFEMVHPTDGKFSEARLAIRKLENLKEEFLYNRQQMVEGESQKQSVVSRTTAMLLDEIPDYSNKADKLTKFATDELGMTLEDIRHLTDPTVSGDRAVRVTVAVNKLYEKFNAGKNAEKKVDKKAPAPLGRAGAANESAADATDLSNLPMPEYIKRREAQIYKK